MADEDLMLQVGDSSASLLDVAGINMDEVDAVRFIKTPAGFFLFKIADAKLGVIGRDEKKKFAAQFSFEIVNVLSLKDEKEDPAKWVGKSHNENFTIAGESMLDDIGRVKAFFEDIGFKGSGTLADLLEQSKGYMFQGSIAHKPDRNDKDVIYANLDRDSKKLKAFDPAAA